MVVVLRGKGFLLSVLFCPDKKPFIIADSIDTGKRDIPNHVTHRFIGRHTRETAVKYPPHQ